jgi:hypothetical protein
MINYFKSNKPIKCWICNKECIPTLYNNKFNFNFECNNNSYINEIRCYQFAIEGNSAIASIGLSNIIDFGTQHEVTQISFFKVKNLIHNRIIHYSIDKSILLHEEKIDVTYFINLNYKDYYLNIIESYKKNLLFI